MIKNDRAYSAEPVLTDGSLNDVRIMFRGKAWHMAGRGGKEREISMAERLLESPGRLPVLIGAGFGHALAHILEKHGGPVAVVDREAPLLELTRVREKYAGDARVTWIDEAEPGEALARLTRWQMEHGGRPFAPLAFPVYLRLDRDYYARLKEQLEASRTANFWEKARYPKFRSGKPRILLVTSQYFLMGEIVAACERLDVPHRLLNLESKEKGCSEFVEELLKAVLEFRPDFVLTVNHLGVDREGILAGLLEQLQLPLASWFVDNPHLILYMYNRVISDLTTVFTWDADNIPSLREFGFSNVHHLPLGTDVHRFRPGITPPGPDSWRADVSFVGNSMVSKVAHRLKRARPDRTLLLRYREIAEGFADSPERSVRDYLVSAHPELMPHFEALKSVERKLSFETLVTWEATRLYRASCVEAIMPFNPLIVGDKWWHVIFGKSGHDWRYHPELAYYTHLPRFYPLSTINFNCTSKQMKGAINQRVFDVPACGAFLLTDYREQMEEMFEPGKEVAFYRSPEEATDLARFYLKNETARKRIIEGGRNRVLKDHTYEQRITRLVSTMKDIYG